MDNPAEPVAPETTTNPYRPPEPDDIRPAFSVGALLLTTTLVAVVIASWFVAPGLAIALALVATPAFIRTAILSFRKRAIGAPTDMSTKINLFLASSGIFLAIWLGVGISFYATCWAGFVGGAFVSEQFGARNYDPLGYGLMVGCSLGFIASMTVFGFLIRKLFKADRKSLAQESLAAPTPNQEPINPFQ